MIYAGTGHRPERLGLDFSDNSNQRLTAFLLGELEKLPDVTSVISGMAVGFDQALAEAAIQLCIPVWAALPFPGQELKWPASGQARYRKMLEKCENVVEVNGRGYASWKFLERDRYMVDHCQGLISLFDGDVIKGGGTAWTVTYANRVSVPVISLWGAWCVFRGT